MLAEPIQTVMRRYGIEKPYEKLKALTRGKAMTPELIAGLSSDSWIFRRRPQDELLALTPALYIGNAAEQARAI